MEQDKADKMARFEAACEKAIGEGDSCLREEIAQVLGVSETTVNRLADKSQLFMRLGTPGMGKARIVRRGQEGA